MVTDLLSLPLNVLHPIYSLLLYSELTKLQMTYRQLQDVDADDIVRSALLSLRPAGPKLISDLMSQRMTRLACIQWHF